MSKSRVRSPSVVLPAKVLLPLRMLGAALITALAVGLMVPVPSAGATPSEPVQRGGDIDGEALGDQSGYSVALSADGDTMAIGAWLNDPTIDGILANNAGHVRIYRWNGSVWDQRGGDIDGEAAGDQSGRSVALSADGDTVAIGAHLNDGNGSNAGHVRIYAWNGSGWDRRGGDIDGEAAGDESGLSVALSADGDTVAIGGWRNDGNGDDAGHVRIFAWDGSGWDQRGGDIDGEAAGDISAYSVALSADGDTVAIGAPYNDGNGDDAGHVRIYGWDGSGWVQRGGDIDGEAVSDQGGAAVALSADGDTVAISAPLNNSNGDGAGRVRVYAWNGSGWVQRGGDIDGEAAGDQSGRGVALSADGDTVAIGAHLNDGNGDAAGHVRIYAWDGAGWDQRGGDIDGEAAGDQSGRWVALSADGDTVAIGAPGNGGSGSNAGHVRVVAFAVNGAGAALPPSVSCAPLPPVAGASVTCTVTGGDAGIDILWRAAYNPVIAETGVTLDASGSGTFSFTVPAAALGEELTVELVEWTAPLSLGTVGGPVPTSVPSGEGPVPAWSLVLAVLIALGLLRRRAFGSVEG